jgi:hypothetical protein
VIRAFENPILGEPVHSEEDLEEPDREFLLFDLIRVERALERAKKAPLPDIGHLHLEEAEAKAKPQGKAKFTIAED